MRISTLGKNRNIARRKGGLQGNNKVVKKDWIAQTGEKSMEYFMMPAQKVPLQHFRKTEKDVIGGLCSLANIPLTPETARDQERRIRREIANSNERRRMQSINAGFQSLKTLIPHSDGEKLSKAAILQQTSDYIFSLEQEKTRLMQQNSQLKRFIQEFSGSSPKRRRVEEKDEGIGSPDILEEEKAEDLRREMIELRQQLEKERSVRMLLEEQVRSLDANLYPEKLKEIAQQVQDQQAQMQTQTLLRLQQLREQKEKEQKPRSPQVSYTQTVLIYSMTGIDTVTMQCWYLLGFRFRLNCLTDLNLSLSLSVCVSLSLSFSWLQAPATPPAPTHHATVIVPAPTLPLPPHHITVVTMSPASVINTVSTSRQNLDTIVQAIQHIEGTQEKSSSAEEDQRRAVIVTSTSTSTRAPPNTSTSTRAPPNTSSSTRAPPNTSTSTRAPPNTSSSTRAPPNTSTSTRAPPNTASSDTASDSEGPDDHLLT
ncbi:transcription factor AP-4-like isoform X1 [Anguilla rostrata]